MEIFPFIIAIIYFVITSISRMNQKNKNEVPKRQIPKNLDPMHPKHFGDLFKNMESTTTTKGIQESSKIEPAITHNEYTTSLDEIVKRQHPVKVQPKNVKPIRKSSTSLSVHKLSNKRLMEGIVLAEVLGSPRAHKPHHSYQSRKQ